MLTFCIVGIIPLLHEEHWLLLVIDPRKETLLWLTGSELMSTKKIYRKNGPIKTLACIFGEKCYQ